MANEKLTALSVYMGCPLAFGQREANRIQSKTRKESFKNQK